MNNPNELRHQLQQHTGSQSLFRHGLMRGIYYTEGVHDFAENAGGGCFWLLDILASEPAILGLVRAEGIAFATLAVADGKATLTVTQDSGIPPVFTRAIDSTDCPEGDWMIYLSVTEVGGQAGIVLLLPSEY